MTDDEILELKDTTISKEPTDAEIISFARTIEQRTLTNQKARWYQEGVEAEREACAKICDDRADADTWEGGYAHNCAVEIRARGD